MDRVDILLCRRIIPVQAARQWKNNIFVVSSWQQFSPVAVKDAEVMREELFDEWLSLGLANKQFILGFAHFWQLYAILLIKDTTI